MVGGGYGVCMPSASSRRMREFIPESKKDDEYWMKRQKNNEAAKRSREKRRANDAIMARRIHELTTENKRLKLELIAIRRQFGLVPGTYVIPSDGPASSSDDGLSSPQPCSSSSHELTVAASAGSDSNMPPLVSCRQVACPSDAEYGYHRRLECSTSGSDMRSAAPLGAAFSCAKSSYGGGQHHDSYSKSHLLVSAGSSGTGVGADGLVDFGKSNGLESNGGSGVASFVYEDDRIMPPSSQLRLTSATFDSRRSNDAFSNVFSDVSSSDDSDSFDGSSQDTSLSYALVASRRRDPDVSNGAGCRNPAAGETPLNLSAAPGRVGVSAEFMHGSKHANLSTSSRLWRNKSASPDVVRSVVAGVDLSIPSTLPSFRETRSETIPPLLPVPKSVNDVRPMTAVTSAKFEVSPPDVTVGDVVPPCGGDSAANRSTSLPSLAAFHGSVAVPATGVSETKWTQQSQCQPQEDAQSGGSRQVRRGVPLKVWHKLAALRAEDGDVDQSPGPDDDRADDTSVSKRPCIFERRSLSVDCSSFHMTSQDVMNQVPPVASAATAYVATGGLATEQELIETKRLLRFDRQNHAGRLDHPIQMCGSGFPSSTPLGDTRLPAPASSINDFSPT
jgi:hypothetical protein